MTRILAWFARTPVAANLLMMLLIIGGLFGLGSARIQVFPEFQRPIVLVTATYPGATPEDVESLLCAPIEERIRDLPEVDNFYSISSEGIGIITVELHNNVDQNETREKIKARIDAIPSFPANADKPLVENKLSRRSSISVIVSGESDSLGIQRLAEILRQEIANIPGITQVEISRARSHEITIELSRLLLLRYGLSFDDVANAIRQSSVNVPGGAIKGTSEALNLRTTGQATEPTDFEKIVVKRSTDGSRTYLRDIATVRSQLSESSSSTEFDGLPAVEILVFRTGNQHATDIAEKVKAYISERAVSLPEGIKLTAWHDDTQMIEGRLVTLVKNARDGLLLVLIVLALFLNFRVAFWVASGIPVAFLGTLWIMPKVDIPIHVISLFGFIVVLGIVVDDAIVVAESIFHHRKLGSTPYEAALQGLQKIAMPVTFSAVTTIAAFAPLLIAPSPEIFGTIPMIVIITLAFSLVESLLILPAHLSHMSAPDERTTIVRRRLNAWGGAIKRTYLESLERIFAWRYTVLCCALALALVSLGIVVGEHVKFEFFPTVDADEIAAFLTLPHGYTPEMTREKLVALEESLLTLKDELEKEGHADIFRHTMITVGSHPLKLRQSAGQALKKADSSHLAEINVSLSPQEDRTIGATEIISRWRETTPEIADAAELSYNSKLLFFNNAVEIEISGPSLEELSEASDAIMRELAALAGVIDISSSLEKGKRELEIEAAPEAGATMLTTEGIGNQVRKSFYGEEIQRIQRDSREVRVMIRYAQIERSSPEDLAQTRIPAPSGSEIPFAAIGETSFQRGFRSIHRVDGNRSAKITAGVDLRYTDSATVTRHLQERFLPGLLSRHESIELSFKNKEDEEESILELAQAFTMAIFIIYSVLAVVFGSYVRPLVVLSAVPFGFIGALGGHILIGYDLTIWSLYGIVAVTGVVVNDNLVLVEFINRSLAKGVTTIEAIRQACSLRLRPITMTSLTTFAGLIPLLLEPGLDAKIYLAPMATSIAFGVIFATAITLVLVPVLYLISEDMHLVMRSAKKRYLARADEVSFN